MSSNREYERALTELSIPQVPYAVHGGVRKGQGIYSPPFVRVTNEEPQYLIQGQAYNATDSQGHIVSSPVYGAAEEPWIDAGTLANIQMIAPPVAQLIAGLTPEEAIVALRGKIEQLQPYKNVPIKVASNFVKGKIKEYRDRIKVLEKQADAEKFKRLATYAGYTLGTLSIGSLFIILMNRAIKSTKQNLE